MKCFYTNNDMAILDIAESFNDACPVMMKKYKNIGTQIRIVNIKDNAIPTCVIFLNYLVDYGVPAIYKSIEEWFKNDLFPIIFEKNVSGHIIQWNIDMSTGKKTKEIWPYYYWIWFTCWSYKNVDMRTNIEYMKLVEKYRNAGTKEGKHEK